MAPESIRCLGLFAGDGGLGMGDQFTPKYFAKLCKAKLGHRTRDYGMNFNKIIKDYQTKEEVYEEMEEWAKSGIWYAHLTTLNESLQNHFKEAGFGVYEYFGETGISWSNSQFDGAVKFEPEKHLMNLESGDLLFGRLNGEGLNFYMQNNTTARIGTSMFTVNVIEGFKTGELQINEIQKKSYWES